MLRPRLRNLLMNRSKRGHASGNNSFQSTWDPASAAVRPAGVPVARRPFPGPVEGQSLAVRFRQADKPADHRAQAGMLGITKAPGSKA
jgi:hypothetical protein